MSQSGPGFEAIYIVAGVVTIVGVCIDRVLEGQAEKRYEKMIRSRIAPPRRRSTLSGFDVVIFAAYVAVLVELVLTKRPSEVCILVAVGFLPLYGFLSNLKQWAEFEVASIISEVQRNSDILQNLIREANYCQAVVAGLLVNAPKEMQDYDAKNFNRRQKICRSRLSALSSEYEKRFEHESKGAEKLKNIYYALAIFISVGVWVAGFFMLQGSH